VPGPPRGRGPRSRAPPAGLPLFVVVGVTPAGCCSRSSATTGSSSRDRRAARTQRTKASGRRRLPRSFPPLGGHAAELSGEDVPDSVHYPRHGSGRLRLPDLGSIGSRARECRS
jgi:hypothetical protein